MDATILQTATVGAAMAREFERVTPGTSLREAAAAMRSRRGRALVVDTDDGKPSIITEFDIVKAVDDLGSIEGVTVGERRTRVAVAGTPDWTLQQAVDTMLQGGFRHLIVIDGKEVVGMLSMRDIVEQIVEPTDYGELMEDTVEIGAQVAADANRIVHQYRRSAKQHFSAIKCPCELDMIEIIVGQLEERPNLTATEISAMWDQRQECPTLHSDGGGAD